MNLLIREETMTHIRISLGGHAAFRVEQNFQFISRSKPLWSEKAQDFLDALALMLSVSILVHSVLFHVSLISEIGLFVYIGAFTNIIVLYHYKNSFRSLLGKKLPVIKISQFVIKSS